MKRIVYLTIIISAFTLINNPLFAQKKVVEDSIKVYGNCTMCKSRIEAALEKPGIKFADWNVDTKKLFVAYRPDKVTIKEIHQYLAAVGHDTDEAQAADSVYAALNFCCLYRDHDPHESGEDDHNHK